ncbi:MAG: lysophospholipid acyltransferase family protein [Anaerolineae bacterium]|nr:lysophospholipid acyltransferase family protein [Anaerolineae bacterium]
MQSSSSHVHPFLVALSRVILRLIGWGHEGSLPDLPKYIIVAYPHTANMDGLIVVLTALSLRLQINWMGKDSLFKPPLGWLMRLTGGVPIDRSSSHRALKSSVQAFQSREHMVLVIAPEGTRGRAESLKPGFYFLAQKAKVPLALSSIHYGRKVVRFGPVIEVTGDMQADMAPMYDFYADSQGRIPENTTPLQLPTRRERAQPEVMP